MCFLFYYSTLLAALCQPEVASPPSVLLCEMHLYCCGYPCPWMASNATSRAVLTFRFFCYFLAIYRRYRHVVGSLEVAQGATSQRRRAH